MDAWEGFNSYLVTSSLGSWILHLTKNIQDTQLRRAEPQGPWAEGHLLHQIEAIARKLWISSLAPWTFRAQLMASRDMVMGVPFPSTGGSDAPRTVRTFGMRNNIPRNPVPPRQVEVKIWVLRAAGPEEPVGDEKRRLKKPWLLAQGIWHGLAMKSVYFAPKARRCLPVSHIRCLRPQMSEGMLAVMNPNLSEQCKLSPSTRVKSYKKRQITPLL
ncbi:hypothetical protein M747DRAFT_319019 [Aspergillus niger ATCC 13496]|uniref:Uncharacterized protein n=1 Tax=Aspergillus niger ATCC 13496 TaxID=1353008 RepID=A0A370BHI3_ASPNG|nr:hypothetical protein M747DRAFT_319019 [Aspergillus niger ATCC 13496]